MDELVHEFTKMVEIEGTVWRARVIGHARDDGTWVGALEFVGPVGEIRRTGRETTQPDRDALHYWAHGLEPVYLEGAFERARAVDASDCDT